MNAAAAGYDPSRQAIIDLVERCGGMVSLRNAGDDRPLAVFSAALGREVCCGLQGWVHALLVVPTHAGWYIRFPGDGETRLLGPGELCKLLQDWLVVPDSGVFRFYRREQAAS